MGIKKANLYLLVWSVVFIFLNIIVLLAYTQVLKQPTVLDSRVDVIFISRGRNRLDIQHRLWLQKWNSISTTRFIVIYTGNVIENELTETNLIHIHSNFMSQEDIFINLHSLVPNESTRSQQFLFVSDNIIPVQNVGVELFWKNGLGWRFFNGILPDMMLFGIQDKVEKTIPVMLFSYDKLTNYHTFFEFQIAFIASKSHVFSNMAQIVVLPNSQNKIKKHLKNELFQVVHLAEVGQKDHATTNGIIIEKWRELL